MCNFNLISYCKGIVLFQSNCVILLLLSEINCVNDNVIVGCWQMKILEKTFRFEVSNSQALQSVETSTNRCTTEIDV